MTPTNLSLDGVNIFFFFWCINYPFCIKYYFCSFLALGLKNPDKIICFNIIIYAPIESPSQIDSKNIILKFFGSDSDEKNTKTGQKYEFPTI